MVCNIKLVDSVTGEIISDVTKDYVFNFSVSHDAGFDLLKRWFECAVRGVRTTKHSSLTLNISLSESKPLPLEFASSDVRKQNQYVY